MLGREPPWPPNPNPGESRPNMISLVVNGKPRSADDGIDLEAYITSFGLNLEFVAIGYNGVVLKKEEYPQVHLQEGDTLEIVRPVGGGL